ncbi:MAG: PHP domain-containing protein, partial [Rhodospirillaceae bacterium]|nr:PHP domain-containing protein [Rhodospirillaceae bacterium]
MAHADFVHLRVHDAFSLSEGAIKIPDLAALCTKYDMPAVGVADTGNLFGALEFSLAARGKGIQPIVGCQLAIQREDANVHGGGNLGSDWIVLLAQSEEGYGNLLELVSRSYLSSAAEDSPQVSLDDLEACNAGLIALTGGVSGGVGRLLVEGQRPAAEEMLLRLAKMFEGRLYVELMRHGQPDEEQIEPALIEMAYSHNLPLVATNEVFFADRSMYEAHDALMCIAAGATVSRTDRRRVTPEHYFKSPEEMRELFADLPEAIDNTLVVAQRCAYMPDTRAPILPPYPKLQGRGEEEVLREMWAAGREG